VAGDWSQSRHDPDDQPDGESVPEPDLD
jgi:hypothetical protein